MKIHLITVGNKMPGWVKSGTDEYLKRMPAACSVQLHEIPPQNRGGNQSVDKIKADEADRIEAKIPKQALKVVCDERGKPWSTRDLADRMADWMGSGRDVAIVVGGPDGLTDEMRQSADALWSLSALTLPHPLVRILLAEQLYRGWSLLNNHPYHRA